MIGQSIDAIDTPAMVVDLGDLEFNLKLIDKGVGKGTFIKVKHPLHGWVLGRIDSLKTYLDHFDEDETQAHAYTIGYFDGKEVLYPKTPIQSGHSTCRQS